MENTTERTKIATRESLSLNFRKFKAFYVCTEADCPHPVEGDRFTPTSEIYTSMVAHYAAHREG